MVIEQTTHKAMKKEESKKRYITLCDGTTMGDELIIIKTNAPIALLKKLEKESCEVYLLAGDDTDVPKWYEEVEQAGYAYEYITSYQHITAGLTSEEALEAFEEKNKMKITEHYVIENQPELSNTKNSGWKDRLFTRIHNFVLSFLRQIRH